MFKEKGKNPFRLDDAARILTEPSQLMHSLSSQTNRRNNKG